MPVIKSAIKKFRRDRKLTIVNRKKLEVIRSAIKKAKRSPTAEHLRKALSLIDKGAKTHLIHKNKAARLKSKLGKLLTKKAVTAKAASKPKDRKVKATPVAKKTTRSVKSGL